MLRSRKKEATRLADRMVDMVDALEQRNEMLEKTCKRLKKQLNDKEHNDKRLVEMQERLETMQSDLMRGFSITKTESERIHEWTRKHEQEVHNITNDDERLKRGGAIGGTYRYIFIPTSIGIIGEISCSCGKRFCFQDLM